MKSDDGPNESEQIHDLGNGVIKFYLNDGNIAVYNLTELTGPAVHILVKDMIGILDEWSPDTPYVVLVDVSQCTPNKLSRQQAIQVSDYRPEVEGRVAILISNSIQWQVTRNVLESAFSEQGRVRRLFTDRQVALQWLRETTE